MRSRVLTPGPFQQRQATISNLDMTDPKSYVRLLEIDPSLKNLKALHVCLVEKDGAWLGAFVSSGGLVALLDVIDKLSNKTTCVPRRPRLCSWTDSCAGRPSLFDVVLQVEGIRCIRSLLNHAVRSEFFFFPSQS